MKKFLTTIGGIIGVGAGGLMIWKVVIPTIAFVFSMFTSTISTLASMVL